MDIYWHYSEIMWSNQCLKWYIEWNISCTKSCYYLLCRASEKMKIITVKNGHLKFFVSANGIRSKQTSFTFLSVFFNNIGNYVYIYNFFYHSREYFLTLLLISRTDYVLTYWRGSSYSYRICCDQIYPNHVLCTDNILLVTFASKIFIHMKISISRIHN